MSDDAMRLMDGEEFEFLTSNEELQTAINRLTWFLVSYKKEEEAPRKEGSKTVIDVVENALANLVEVQYMRYAVVTYRVESGDGS